MGLFCLEESVSNNNYQFWKSIWDSKGNSESTDLLFLDGYEHLGSDFSSAQITSQIIESLNIEKNSSILEVATGCGFLARELNENYRFVGVDYSEAIINKHKKLFNHEVYVCESNNLFFEDNSFDYVFCYGLFQYLPNTIYAEQTISEMHRISKKGIFLGDLKNKKTRDTHFVFPKKSLIDLKFTIIESEASNDDADRYSAFRRF